MCLFFTLQPTESIGFCGDSCHDAVIVCCFKDIKKLPKKYDANTNSENITMTIEDYCVQLGWKVGAQFQKTLLFTDQCAAHSKNTTFLTNIKV